jgi:hypothetical protein
MSESGHDGPDLKPLSIKLSNIRSQNRIQLQDNSISATGGFLTEDDSGVTIQFRNGESFAILHVEPNELEALFLGSLETTTIVYYVGYEWDKPYGESYVGNCSMAQTR